MIRGRDRGVCHGRAGQRGVCDKRAGQRGMSWEGGIEGGM